ncbi:hypothetical protein N7456_009609 [Penicillium angulare]|uniref:Uncharacterized protein n=1 Tax=Penicillium angulare TaxID=116970 RepID=A0A9W9K5D4_9EURO|nr:hypothetical protein N7456_009609 [Penicillium angulare]
MDLNRSYANDEEYIVRAAEPEPRPPRQQRWTHEGEEPLTDPTQLPLGWNADEPDLDPEDINAQITRAEERIADNIMPHAFQHKLDYYRGYRTRNDEIQARWPANLDWNVLNRLEVLTRIAMDLEGNGDKNNQLLNVRAIIEAYRNRTIQINGLVTYWSRGVQISQPRPFDWDEFLSINSHHEGSTSFWVEGVRVEVTP